MKPFFPYFGSKFRLAKRYPEPRGVVAEPFAGSACYSTYWGVEKAVFVDTDPNVARVWNFLLGATPDDVMALPDVYDEGDSPLNYDLPEGAAELIGFWLIKSTKPATRRGTYAASDKWRSQFWRPEIRERIAGQVERIKSWTFLHGDYRLATGRGDTYFIDPPYKKAGVHYAHRFTDYEGLSEWSRSLSGGVIVCEGVGGDWLDFESLGNVKSFTGSAEEKVWTRGFSE